MAPGSAEAVRLAGTAGIGGFAGFVSRTTATTTPAMTAAAAAAADDPPSLAPLGFLHLRAGAAVSDLLHRRGTAPGRPAAGCPASPRSSRRCWPAAPAPAGRPASSPTAASDRGGRTRSARPLGPAGRGRSGSGARCAARSEPCPRRGTRWSAGVPGAAPGSCRGPLTPARCWKSWQRVEAVLPVLCHRLVDRPIDDVGDTRDDARRGRRVLVHDLVQELARITAGEGPAPGEHLVEHAARARRRRPGDRAARSASRAAPARRTRG